MDGMKPLEDVILDDEKYLIVMDRINAIRDLEAAYNRVKEIVRHGKNGSLEAWIISLMSDAKADQEDVIVAAFHKRLQEAQDYVRMRTQQTRERTHDE